MKSTLTALALVLLLFSTASAQERFARYADEADKDSSFKRFHTRLVAAVKRRDVKYVLGVLDPNIKVSFGGDGGIADFKKYWRLNRRDSKLWEELGAVLSGGGFMSRDGGTVRFTAPFSFEGFPDDLDAFSNHVVFGKAVALREAPSTDSRVLERLSYNIVTLVGEKTVTVETGEHTVPTWYFVNTLGGLSGYVSAKYIRSPIDYRAIFEKKDGKWRLTAFVAGD
jgi:hypothetical protein